MLCTSDIKKAAKILINGGVVAFPTETVYGLGADAQNPRAVEQVFAIKQRPNTHPLIVHIGDVDQLTLWAREIPSIAYELAEYFWPGPLTFILKKQANVLNSVTSGQDTIALRMPNHPLALALLKEVGRGLVGPSANKFTHISPTTAQAVYDELGEQVAMILDGGACSVGLESTILDLSSEVPTILRPGMLSAEMISHRLQIEVATKNAKNISVPGMHAVHYAPKTRALLFSHPTEIKLALQQGVRIGFLTYKREMFAYLKSHEVAETAIIQMSAEPGAYAKKLYQCLRDLDQLQFDLIAIERVPDDLGWIAIQDRLVKSCGCITDNDH